MIGAALGRYVIAVSIAANQLANALSGGRPDETISSRLGHARSHGSAFAGGACHVLDWIDHHHQRPQEDHCDKAMRHYRERLQTSAS